MVVGAIKKYKNDGIYMLGRAARDVTGSCLYLRWRGFQMLIECGIYQSNDVLEAYNTNKNLFNDIDMSEIDAIVVGHLHADHESALPLAWRKGFEGKIYMTPETARISKDLMLNSAYIMYGDATYLTGKYRKQYEPLYDKYDVETVMDYIETIDTYNVDVPISKDGNVSIRFLPNSHCIGATQIIITLKDGTQVKKVYYSSDLGAIHTQNHFVNDLQMVSDDEYFAAAFMESTYGDGKRDNKRKRKKDLDILKTVTLETIEKGGKVIIPSFAAVRAQEVLYSLYKIFGNDDSFKTDVIVDSPLMRDICKDYSAVLKGVDKVEWEEVLAWGNIKFTADKKDSIAAIKNRDKPVVVLSSSGFCTNGRVTAWLQEYLNDPNSSLVFVGYLGGDNSYLAYRIKNSKPNEAIKINGRSVENKINIVALQTFSSHAPCDDLVKIGAGLRTEKLILQHGSTEAKDNLKRLLEKELPKRNKSFKVICANQGMFIRL